MTDAGIFLVVGPRSYRGHPPGTTFHARLDRGAERRAVARGHIRLLERVVPSLQPGTYRFPPGWIPADQPHDEGSE